MKASPHKASTRKERFPYSQYSMPLRVLLIASSPFTGKTALLQKHLVDEGQECYLIDLLTYAPARRPLSEFVSSSCNMTLDDLFSETERVRYILFDEFQTLYAVTLEEVRTCYHCSANLGLAERIVTSHQEFHNLFKSAMRDPNIRLICFSAYGQNKFGFPLCAAVFFSEKDVF
jgi:hypothetical protein